MTRDFSAEDGRAGIGQARGETTAMAEDERTKLQEEVDASERDVENRYVSWQELMTVITEAAARADAMFRLERALELKPAP